MCNNLSTPEQGELFGYFQKQDVNQRNILKVEDYPHYYHADGFTRPYLPILASDNQDAVVPARWKLLPYWVKTEEEAWKYANTLNARSEEVYEKASYKNYIKKNRCLLFAGGFYEPYHPKPRVTVPYFITHIENAPIAMGCIYADWTDQDTGVVTRTFTIITTEPNELLGKIHNEGQRMPLILTPDKWDQWLNDLDKDRTVKMMQPLADGLLKAHPVTNDIYKRKLSVEERNTPAIQARTGESILEP
jgi:putative SOS response-associated peptidase YedK